MQKDLLGKIDLLIEMSKSTSNIDTLKAELDEINDEIENKKREIEELSHSMKDEKYMKASDRIIDENIKVSLELKIRKLESNKKEQERELKRIVKQENEVHKKQAELKEKISCLQSLLDTLKEKCSSVPSSNAEIKEYYTSLVNDTEKKLNKTDIELRMQEEEYKKVTADLTQKTETLKQLETQIQKEKEKLTDTEKSLESNETYIDTKLKQEDTNRLQDLEEKLEELEKRKEEIDLDAVMIGNVAKELLVEDDRTGCFQKIKELVELLKKMPYMEIATKKELDTVLKEEEERAIQERDEFASVIENKKYDGNDSQIIQDREHHLEKKQQELEKAYQEKKKQIEEIDTVEVREISALLSAATIIGETIKKELAEYKKVVEEESENLTPKKKAVLIAAYNKKEEELQTVESIMRAYENDLEALMNESKTIATEEMKKIEEKQAKIAEDLKEIHKKSMMDSKTKDILAVENDKAKLKELTKKVKDITEMKKYAYTPTEIYNEIQNIMAPYQEEKEPMDTPEVEQTKPETNNFRIPNDYSFEKDYNRSEKNKYLFQEEQPEEKIEESEPIQEINLDIPWEPVEEVENIEPMVSQIDEPVSEKEEEKTSSGIENFEPTKEEVPTISPFEIASPVEEAPKEDIQKQGEETSPVTERWKVINIEPLEGKEEPSSSEPIQEEDVVLSDVKDDDYIDFDSLIGGGVQ